MPDDKILPGGDNKRANKTSDARESIERSISSPRGISIRISIERRVHYCGRLHAYSSRTHAINGGFLVPQIFEDERRNYWLDFERGADEEIAIAIGVPRAFFNNKFRSNGGGGGEVRIDVMMRRSAKLREVAARQYRAHDPFLKRVKRISFQGYAPCLIPRSLNERIEQNSTDSSNLLRQRKLQKSLS